PPAHALAKGLASDLRPGEGFDNRDCSVLVIEEIVVGAEKVADAVLRVKPNHLLGDSLSALDAMLTLVVRGDRAVSAREFAAERQHQRADRRVVANLALRERLSCERRTAARGFEDAVPQTRVRQLVQIREQPLWARLHQFLRNAIAVVPA